LLTKYKNDLSLDNENVQGKLSAMGVLTFLGTCLQSC